MHKKDVIVVGAGVAGLSFAIQLAKEKSDCQIAVLAKGPLDYSNTFFAQGGIATVTDFENDSFEAHIQDTLASGQGLSSPATVRFVVESGPARIADLVEYGVDFNRTEDGDFDLALEGGHGVPRVVHAFDHTGADVQKALLNTASKFENIQLFENRYAIELLQGKSGRVVGVSVLNIEANDIEFFEGKKIILATGGSGQVYKNTTNPGIATGDGIGMGMRVEAMFSHLNFVQFHPTALYEKEVDRQDLLTEAIRGFGAYVVNKKGERFLFETDERGELATRDIVAGAIFKELKKSGEPCVYLDCRHLEATAFLEKFPRVSENLKKKGWDITTELIPVVPASHYQNGGLTVNEKGQTSVEGLYAIGECADTGLHGANRLASNSLLEGLVYGYEVAEWIASVIAEIKEEEIETTTEYELSTKCDEVFKNSTKEIRGIMSDYATIVSTEQELEVAKIKLTELAEFLAPKFASGVISTASLTAQNLLSTAQAIVSAKLKYTKQNLKEIHTIKKMKL